jgi:two-component system, LytTR family, response regulator
MRSLIADDEESARARLSRMLAAHPDIEIAGEACDGLEAVQKIEELRPDLLFLDIEMPGLTGFQVLQSVRRTVPLPLVIFVTGYDQHALAAFEADALAYLLKPVAPERLAQVLDRARKFSGSPDENEREREHVLQVVRGSPRGMRHVVCRKRDRMLLIVPENILWFASEDGIVKAHTESEVYWVNYQLAELESSLPEELFFRARREVLVNVNQIKEIRPYFKSGFLLIMSDAAATEIVVSARQVHPLRQRIPGL